MRSTVGRFSNHRRRILERPKQLELEYRLEKLLDRDFCCLGGCGVETYMRIKLYAWGFVSEWLFGRSVNQQARGVFTYEAVAHSLAAGNN
jgi:hypothetical protein